MSMIIRFGKYAGTSVNILVLREPAYVAWVLRLERPSGPLAEVRQEAIRLIRHFNGLRLQKRCRGWDCGKRATRASVPAGGVRPMWWCDDCNPDSSGASPGRLRIIVSYGDALHHVFDTCGGRKQDLRILVRELAQAKGLPTRVGEREASSFFGR